MVVKGRRQKNGRSNYRWKKRSMSSKVSRISNKLSQLYRAIEYKKIDINKLDAYSYDVSNSGVVLSLCHNEDGSGPDDRIGNKITAKSVYLQVRQLQHASAVQGSCVRYILFYDTQQVADGVPAVSDVLDSQFSQQYALAPLSAVNGGRFQVIRDVKVNCPNDVGQKYFKIYKKLNLNIRFNGASSADINKNILYLLIVSDESANTPNVSFTSRVRYIDL